MPIKKSVKFIGGAALVWLILIFQERQHTNSLNSLVPLSANLYYTKAIIHGRFHAQKEVRTYGGTVSPNAHREMPGLPPGPSMSHPRIETDTRLQGTGKEETSQEKRRKEGEKDKEAVKKSCYRPKNPLSLLSLFLLTLSSHFSSAFSSSSPL